MKIGKNHTPASSNLFPRHPERPEIISQPGQGIDRRTLLNGMDVRTRILLGNNGRNGPQWEIIIAGGNDLNDGYTPGDRPPLALHIGNVHPGLDTHETPQEQAGRVVAFPYGSHSLRQKNGVYVGEELEDYTFDGIPPRALNLGRIVSIEYMRLSEALIEHERLTQDERHLQTSFDVYQPVIDMLTQYYQHAQNGVQPPHIMS